MAVSHITINPRVRWGTPMIRDTGVSVASVIALDRAGLDLATILASYPTLVPADITAARGFLDEYGDDALAPHPPDPGPDHPRIEVDPRIQGGVPVVRGTRIPVDTIVGMWTEGFGVGEILAEYPTLTADDVDEALAYDEALDDLIDEALALQEEEAAEREREDAPW